MSLDLALLDVTLSDRPGRWSFGVTGGRIVERTEGDRLNRTGADADEVVRADGRLLSPAFVDPHTHLDKCFTAGAADGLAPGARLHEVADAMRRHKAGLSVEDVQRRADRGLRASLAAGVGVVRTNVDVDSVVGLAGLMGVRNAASALAGPALQIVAFPQEGWFPEEGDGRQWVARAVAAGADVVGGNVNGSLWATSAPRQIEEVLDLAVSTGRPADLHLDNTDDPDAFHLPEFAATVMQRGLGGRVVVAHAAALAAVDRRAAADAVAACAVAGVAVVVNPTRVRLTLWRELLQAGVTVAVGTDNLSDAFVPVGDSDPVGALRLLATLGEVRSEADLAALWPLVTTAPAQILGLDGYGTHVGDRADLVLFEACSAAEVIRSRAPRRGVWLAGRLRAGVLACEPASLRPSNGTTATSLASPSPSPLGWSSTAAALVDGSVRAGHFLLDSGRHASRFFQATDFLRGDPALVDAALAELAEPWRSERIDAVLGANPAGSVLAHETARRLGAIPIFAVRDGAAYRVVGSPPRAASRILVVDDVTTTGGTARMLLDAATAVGGRPVGLGLLATKGLVQLDLGVRVRVVSALTGMDAIGPEQCPQCAASIPLDP